MVGPVGTNNRRDPRFEVNLKARAVSRSGAEHEAVVRDISASGAAGTSPLAPVANDTFVDLHIEGYEKYKGRVVREFAGGYALEFDHTEAERKKMAEAIKQFEAVAGRGKNLEA